MSCRSLRLNESPSEKEGKCFFPHGRLGLNRGLNESPSEKEGKFEHLVVVDVGAVRASMKALPKRKGNPCPYRRSGQGWTGLNESPSEKEGKSVDYPPTRHQR